MSRIRALLPVFALVLLASCMADNPFAPDIETTNFDPSLGVDLAASTKTASGLYYRDLTVGGGAQVPAAAGTSVTVSYGGYLRNGTLFDAGDLPPFTTGTGAVIEGFDEGVRGMKVGGRRQLIIPPSLGYGDQRVGSIPPNSILVFVVDLTSIN
jgi:FKBP-type peptidyl-prolyl cis-trans isomerase FkpA